MTKTPLQNVILYPYSLHKLTAKMFAIRYPYSFTTTINKYPNIQVVESGRMCPSTKVLLFVFVVVCIPSPLFLLLKVLRTQLPA